MSDQTEALTALSPASPSHPPQPRMTPISEKESKELEAQAATSHDAPIPCATRDEEAAIGKAKSSDQENQAARRDLLAGIRKLIKSFKSLSHIFEVYKEGDGDEEDMDMNIEIGFPTDVQHVAHIGLDGSSNISSLRGLEGARELLSLSNLTIEQFEFAMASLAAHKEHNVPVVDRVAPNN